MLKIDKYLADLGITKVSGADLHEDFVKPYNELKAKLTQDPEADLTQEDEQLIELFEKLHDVSDDPEEEAQKKADEAKKEAQKQAEEEAAKKTEEEAQKKITKEQLIKLFNSKVHWDYDELKQLGINPDELGLTFEISGYVFEKRHLMKVYSIVEKPKVQ